MNDLSEFEILINKHREAIILASAGAYLHNLGKVARQFFDKSNNQKDSHNQDKVADESSSKQNEYDYQKIIGIYLNCDSDSKNTESSTAVFSTTTKNIMNKPLINLFAPFNDRSYALGDFIELLGQGTELYYNNQKKLSECLNRLYLLTHQMKGGMKIGDTGCLNRTSLLTHLMNRCHDGASGGEKEGYSSDKHDNNTDLFQASPFGYETINATANTSSGNYSEYDVLRKQAEEKIALHLNDNSSNLDLNQFINDMSSVFKKALADNRRPFNSVSVHDIGHSGMAFLKSGIWTLYDQNKREKVSHKTFMTNETCWWKLLSCSLNGQDYLFEAVNLVDLEIRQRKLAQYLDIVQKTIEFNYPVATEIYRDENGSLFIYPDWKKDCCFHQQVMKLLDEKIEAQESWNRQLSLSKMYGIIPKITISSKSFGAHPRIKNRYIGQEFKNIISAPAEADYAIPTYKQLNEANKQLTADLCSYCQMRLVDNNLPVDNSCEDCFKESNNIAQNWWNKKRKETIWISEIADENNHIALIVGQLHFEKYMDSDYFPMKKKAPPRFAHSFARTRRIVDASKDFWDSVGNDLKIDNDEVLNYRLRLRVTQKSADNKIKDYNSYELEYKNLRIEAMWTGDEFVVTENIKALELLIQAKEKKSIKLAEWFNIGDEIKVFKPGSYKKQSDFLITCKIKTKELDKAVSYIPKRILISGPRVFMALIPANQALKAVDYIKVKYEKELGRVKQRLPITLGIIYAKGNTPLRVILDAGKKMLKQQPQWEKCEVLNKSLRTKESNKLYLSLVKNNSKTFQAEYKENLDNSEIKDKWYAHFLSCHCTESNKTNNEKIRNIGDDSKNPRDKCNENSVSNNNSMIHALELKPGNKVWLCFSTFDFEYLDSVSVRFEIAYENGQRKGKDKKHRPYLLEDLDKLREIGDILCCKELSKKQIYNLIYMITQKRQMWQASFNTSPQEGEDMVLRQFCRDAWSAIGLKSGSAKVLMNLDKLADYSVNGWLEDAFLLFLKIDSTVN